ncbi:MAG: hypothetical protein U9R14_01520 [Patescibacteria group bacterium]|nr:hypothetical protein [Patescibacteria group bacterium]
MIIFLYGEDSFRSQQKLKKLKDKFMREVDPIGSSLTELDGANATMEQISASISPGTLLAKKRMIIIKNLFNNKSKTIFGQIYSYLENKKTGGMSEQTDNIIIFQDYSIKTKKARNKEQALKIGADGRDKPLTKRQSQLFKFLIKQKYAQQFNLLSNTQTTAWAKKQVEAEGGKITYQAAQMLTSLVGSDLWQISNEINKLLNYKLDPRYNIKQADSQDKKLKSTGKGKTATIEIEDVKLLVRGNFDENIFSLTDAISNKNAGLAAKLLEEQTEAGLTGSYLINMVIRQFKILLQIRQGLDLNQSSRMMINSLKLHPFIIQKGINQARKFNLLVLKNILSQLVKIDFKMKTGQADVKTMLNLLVARI